MQSLKPRMSTRQLLGWGESNAFSRRCVEIRDLPHDCFAVDVYRLFKPTTAGHSSFRHLRALRRFLPDFTMTNEWVVAFETEQDAHQAFNHLTGRTIATSLPRVSLKPLSLLREYKIVNELIEDLDHCLLLKGPGLSVSLNEMLTAFQDFKLKPKILGSPIHFSDHRLTAIVEFKSRDEAHRAFRRLVKERNLDRDPLDPDITKRLDVYLIQ